MTCMKICRQAEALRESRLEVGPGLASRSGGRPGFALFTIANRVPRAFADRQWYIDAFDDYPGIGKVSSPSYSEPGATVLQFDQIAGRQGSQRRNMCARGQYQAQRRCSSFLPQE